MNENFDPSQALQSIFWREKFVGREERRDFFVEYLLSQKSKSRGRRTWMSGLIGEYSVGTTAI